MLVTDVDAARASAVGGRGSACAPSRPPTRSTTECDVYAPCATGGTLSADTIPGLALPHRRRRREQPARRARPTPTGSARRGILYAPDFVINAGGVFHNVGRESLGWGDAEVEQALEGIGGTLADDLRAERGRGTSRPAGPPSTSRPSASPSRE